MEGSSGGIRPAVVFSVCGAASAAAAPVVRSSRGRSDRPFVRKPGRAARRRGVRCGPGVGVRLRLFHRASGQCSRRRYVEPALQRRFGAPDNRIRTARLFSSRGGVVAALALAAHPIRQFRPPAHGALGVAALVILIAHTGLRPGSGFNLALTVVFLSANVAGAAAAAGLGRSARLLASRAATRTKTARETTSSWAKPWASSSSAFRWTDGTEQPQRPPVRRPSGRVFLRRLSLKLLACLTRRATTAGCLSVSG